MDSQPTEDRTGTLVPTRRTFLTMALLMMSLTTETASAEYPSFNKDETKVPQYTLPDALMFKDGSRVATTADWTNKRRLELLDLFQEHVYGKAPTIWTPYSVVEELVDREALDGKATRKQITIEFAGDENKSQVQVLIYLPNKVEGPAPVFFGLNFGGNHTVHRDPGILLCKSWVENDAGGGVVNNRANDKARSGSRGRWPIDLILDRGYGLVTVYYGDIDPDFDDGFKNGVHRLLHGAEKKQRSPNDCGSIGAWAWGIRMVVSLLVADPDIDAKKIAIMGHSRLGKTALWAGAQDRRIALVVSNNSGCGGAALSRRRFGERLIHINTNFPHWFCENFRGYNEREAELPVDQHMLISLVAPRPVYVASAKEDNWADPRGEFLAAKAAEPVYELFGKEGLGVDEIPKADTPVGGCIGYHLRGGGHDVTEYDWKQYLDFADRHFAEIQP